MVARENACTPPAFKTKPCFTYTSHLYPRVFRSSSYRRNFPFRPSSPVPVCPREQDNEKLHQLLEPKYRTLGAVPPPLPTWSGGKGYGGSSLIGTNTENQNGAGSGTGGSRRVVSLLRLNPLFVVERASVKARVVVPGGSGTTHEQGEGASNHTAALNSTLAATRSAAAGASGVAGGSSAPEEASPSVALSGPLSSPSPSVVAASVAGGGGAGNEHDPADGRTATTDSRRNRLLARAVVKALATAVGEVCEAREEDFLKDRIPGAQAYVAELEAYRSALVGGKPLRAVASSPDGEGGEAGEGDDGGSSVDIDEDLWRIFGAMETRLYSSPAALGKKPGRIYLTFGTLWFHSKVRGAKQYFTQR